MAIASVNAASATSNNWLKEAQASLLASQNAGGMMGALNNAAKNPDGSVRSFLARSSSVASNFAAISFSAQTSANALTDKMAASARQKLTAEYAALAEKMHPVQKNYTPSQGLDAVIYFEDGSSIDTVNNVLTMTNGTKISTVTGVEVVDPASIISMANGAYLDTKKNILTLPDGTKINTITGLIITV